MAAKDTQMTGMAGEFLVAGKLFKRRMQVSITLGNAKAIDLFVYNPRLNKTFNVQVKTLRHKNCYPMRRESLIPDHIYVFVFLNNIDQREQFFMVPGKDILDNINHCFGSSYTTEKSSDIPAINYGPLKEYEDNWEVFEK